MVLLQKLYDSLLEFYDPNQSRSSDGKWTNGGGNTASNPKSAIRKEIDKAKHDEQVSKTADLPTYVREKAIADGNAKNIAWIDANPRIPGLGRQPIKGETTRADEEKAKVAAAMAQIQAAKAAKNPAIVAQVAGQQPNDESSKNIAALKSGVDKVPTPAIADIIADQNRATFQRESERQQDALIAQAKAAGLLIPSPFENRKPDFMGGEHAVAFEGNPPHTVIRETQEFGLTYSNVIHGLREALPTEYLDRVNMSNSTFNTGIVVKGITPDGHIVTETPYIKTPTPDFRDPINHPTNEQVAQYLGDKGFRLAEQGWNSMEYYNPQTNMRLTDCVPRNFMLDDKGAIHPVDVIPSQVYTAAKAGAAKQVAKADAIAAPVARIAKAAADAHVQAAQDAKDKADKAAKDAQEAVDRKAIEDRLQKEADEHNARQQAIRDAVVAKNAAQDNTAARQAREDAAAKAWNDKAAARKAVADAAKQQAKNEAKAAKAWNDKVAARKAAKAAPAVARVAPRGTQKAAVAAGDTSAVQRAADAWNARHRRLSALRESVLEFYSPDQPRDDHGRFGSTDRYQLGLTTYQDAKSFNPEVFEIVRRRIERAIKETPGVLKAAVHPSKGMYFGSEEPSYDAEFTVPKGTDVSPINDLVKHLAAENKQEAAFVTKVTNDKAAGRPILEIAFKKPITDDEAAKLADDFSKHGLGGFTIAKDDKGGTVGVRTQSIPEFGGPAHSEWAGSAKTMIKGMNRTNVARATMRYADTHIYQRGKDY